MTHPTKEEAAYATLEIYGFTYLGGNLWKPPLGMSFQETLTEVSIEDFNKMSKANLTGRPVFFAVWPKLQGKK